MITGKKGKWRLREQASDFEIELINREGWRGVLLLTSANAVASVVGERKKTTRIVLRPVGRV